MENEKAKDDLRAFADKYGLSAQKLKNLTAEVAQELESRKTVSQASDFECVCVGAEVKDYVKGKIYEVDKHLEYTVRAVIAI